MFPNLLERGRQALACRGLFAKLVELLLHGGHLRLEVVELAGGLLRLLRGSELDELKAQMAAMQKKLDELGK